MDDSDIRIPRRRIAPFHEWSPSIHYAQVQTLPKCELLERRIYDFEFLYVKQGEAATTIDGQRHVCRAGQMMCIPPGVRHRNEIVSLPHATLIGIHFDFFDELDIKTDVQMIVRETAAPPERFAVEAVAEGHAPLFGAVSATPPPAFVQLMEDLVTEFNQRNPGYELICKALLLQMLGLLLRSRTALRPDAFDSQHAHGIRDLMKQIEAAPDQPWTNRMLAFKLNLSEDYMIKLFKKLAGQAPGAFVQIVRLREARRLLRDTSLSVQEVGQQVGYADGHYFSRIFGQAEGISPSQYRKLMMQY